jgi:hypothetical protein
MGVSASNVRLALDHNSPAPFLKAFAVMIPNVEVVPIAEIDQHLAEIDDWELFVALHRHEERWDGLVTNDDALLSLPKETTVLSQTNLTLVVAAGEGHNPIRAVGLLLCHLNHNCHHTAPDRPQVWKLSFSQKAYDEPRKYLEKIAEKKQKTVEEIVQIRRIPARELRRTST